MEKKILVILIGFCFLVGCGSASKTTAKHSKKRSIYYDSTGDAATQDSIEDIIYSELSKRRNSVLRRYTVSRDSHSLGGVKFDIPMTVNDRVESWIDYFAYGNGRKYYGKWLARSTRFVPEQLKILKEQNLPRDIIFLSMIESGYNTHAYSTAAASGLWQFIRSTGRLYGLGSDYWVDERRDLEKSTVAAARHLKDLYEEFGDWYLAFAAYNAGSGKVKRAIAATKSRDFWKLASSRYLRRETKDYVPKILAAAIIAKSPEKYGFKEIDYQNPIATEKVTITSPTDLETVAECAGVELDLIRLVNPELIRNMTPLHHPEYTVHLPRGTKETFKTKYAELSPSERLKNVRYVAQKVEPLRTIAKKQGVTVASLQSANPSLRTRRTVSKGTVLLIPKTYGSAPDPEFLIASSTQGERLVDLIAEAPHKTKPERGSKKKKEIKNLPNREETTNEDEIKITSKESSTPAFASEVPATSVNSTLENGLGTEANFEAEEKTSSGSIELAELSEDEETTKTDQEIEKSVQKIESSFTKETKRIIKKIQMKIVSYKVRKGDTLYKIAREHDVSLAEIRKVNGLSKKSLIHPGLVLKIRAKDLALNKG